ncbi:hypothetical protein PC39_13512 [Salinisphaera sp. PC39]|uniref:hypothetical protein n=1 Tax=Salinisphaera sp. PC39 TaxID=1304156 RepID=UPI00333FF5EB
MLNKLREWHQSRDYRAVHEDIRRIGVALIQAGALGSISHMILTQITDKTQDLAAFMAATGLIGTGVIIWVLGWPKSEEDQR